MATLTILATVIYAIALIGLIIGVIKLLAPIIKKA